MEAKLPRIMAFLHEQVLDHAMRLIIPASLCSAGRLLFIDIQRLYRSVGDLTSKPEPQLRCT